MSQTTNLKRIKMSSFNSREEAVHYLINARVHPINASCTKKILTGLSAQENDDFTSVVKIINHSFLESRLQKKLRRHSSFVSKISVNILTQKTLLLRRKKHLTESV